MITERGVDYEVIKIAFPGTKSYNEFAPYKNPAGYLGHSSVYPYYFFFGDFNVEAHCNLENFTRGKDEKGLSLIGVLDERVKPLKKRLEHIKPPLEILKKKNYPHLDGICLSYDCRDFVAPIDYHKRILDKLYFFGNRGYSNLAKDLNALASLNGSVKAGDLENECLLKMSDLAGKVKDYRHSKWLSGDSKAELIAALGRVYEIEPQLSAIIR